MGDRESEDQVTDGRARPELAAWANLRAKLTPFIARRVGESDVDDVLQEVFVRMLRGLPHVREDERWVSWMYSVTRSVIADHHRRVRRRRQSPLDVEDESLALAVVGNAEDEEMYGGAASCVAGFLRSLPAPYGEALALTELEGVSQREAAERLEMSYSGFKSRVQRGREQLRELITDCCRVEVDSRQRVVDFACPASGGCNGCGPDGPDSGAHAPSAE